MLRNAHRNDIEKTTVIELSDSLDGGASSSSSASYADILYLRADGFDAPSESSELSKGGLRDDDESQIHAWEFLDIPIVEVGAYKKTENGDKKYALWHFMGFAKADRLTNHITRCRTQDRNWPTSGLRHMRLDAALYNSDMAMDIHTPALPMAKYIARPTSFCGGMRCTPQTSKQ